MDAENDKNNVQVLNETIGIPSTSHELRTPPSFINQNELNFGNINLTPDMIEAIELLVEAKTIPIIVQLNDMKRELSLMRMSINTIVEELTEEVFTSSKKNAHVRFSVMLSC